MPNDKLHLAGKRQAHPTSAQVSETLQTQVTFRNSLVKLTGIKSNRAVLPSIRQASLELMRIQLLRLLQQINWKSISTRNTDDLIKHASIYQHRQLMRDIPFHCDSIIISRLIGSTGWPIYFLDDQLTLNFTSHRHNCVLFKIYILFFILRYTWVNTISRGIRLRSLKIECRGKYLGYGAGSNRRNVI